MAWSSDIRACKTVWTSLMALDQISENQLFTTAGALKISDLMFYATDAGTAARDIRAKGLAFDLDNIFRAIRGARFEDSVSHVEAIEALVEVLEDESKTVENLADIADQKYHFHNE